MKTVRIVISFFILMALFTACNLTNSGQESIEIRDAWARPALMENTGAVYFTIQNTLNEPDKLIEVDSDVAETSEIHLSSMSDETMKMVKQDYVEIIPNKTVEFKPMSYHVMLINLNQDLNIGDQFEIVLTFEKFGQLQVMVDVKEN